MIRALAIDGGGVRAILPATVLATLEELTGRRAHGLFDLVTGTSAGAMLALGLTRPEPRPALELRGLFLDRGAVIFPPATEPGEPLDPAPLEAELADRLETTAMSGALRPAVAVSCDATVRRPVLFRGGGLDPGPALVDRSERENLPRSGGQEAREPLEPRPLARVEVLGGEPQRL